MKSKLILFLLMFTNITIAQVTVNWSDLGKVKFIDKYFPEYDDTFLQPIFSESIKKLEGEIIQIKGYFLNLDPKGEIFVLSKGPMASCFFCGVGGPETAIELHFKKKPSFKTDDIITITGTLRLNDNDVEHFNYILFNCEAIKN